ncbi:uncharacterized protein EV422DRAFT_601232 [Fimicolochytrium jonesii]|uniref:uncharacterized protein n=1 Tax=Fimicolochytrium jonesii TaxID=1396493 RepID=UPI0022FF1788|nr:uncharacterized protein EV422DRAFT_601232 [Fimicolochytrium jonesii]KAI8826245.1 hypothetical protein EV422DRAFT_601232 [Fimicolochytrium jonesii]
MSFFSFGGEEASVGQANSLTIGQPPATPEAPANLIALDDALLSRELTVIGDCLLTEGGAFHRRSLADIKWEVAVTDKLEKADYFRDAILSQSDLIPGRYEGGLKTWECAVDLVNYLATHEAEQLQGKRVFELGCGSSLPGIFCLGKGALVDLQDYNEEVLRLVTIPNVLLNIATELPPEDEHEGGNVEVDLDFTKLATLPVNFWAGDWASLKDKLADMSAEQKYDIILTSETIYSADSHRKLLDLIKAVIKPGGIAYVAAKTTYFGCSGSLPQFLQLVEEDGSAKEIQSVWVEAHSVRREIVKLQF